MKLWILILGVAHLWTANAGAIVRPENPRATPDCPTSNTRVEHQGNLIHKIAIFGQDGRTFHAANKIPSRHKASGEIKCGDFSATAQLTGASDVITTASHVIYDEIGCRKPPSCTFTPAGGRPVNVRLDLMLATCINEKPDLSNLKPKVDARKDWAVLKLEQPVEGVTPYGIPKQPVESTAVLESTHISIAKRDSRTDFSTQVCNLSHRGRYKRLPMLNNCDNVGGSSGGAHVDESNNLLAINVSDFDRKTTDPQSNNDEFDSNNRANVSVPLAGEFYDAVVAMVNLTTADAGGTRPSN